ncbi:MAG: hypothetical protein IJH39_09950 [Clostridia bacterium]|nr:hypothetical protein [Clostridia bacterium]
MEKDNTNYQPFADFGMQQPGNQYGNFMPDEPFFNPMAQYEQAYVYYRYLCMQMDYKIKCKEYEKMTKNT